VCVPFCITTDFLNSQFSARKKEIVTMVSGGTYVVKESCLIFEHDPNAEVDKPSTPEVFLERFRDKFEMNILEQKENELVFELIHVDPSFVNALRRILIAEVPTVALEHVYMWNNSSIIHDEVLAHRLGLIPLNLDARLVDEPDEEDDAPTDRNTVVFRLNVTCPNRDPAKARDKPKDDDDEEETVSGRPELEEAAAEAALSGRKVQYPKERPYTMHVYSKDLVWVPQGDQEERLTDVRPIHDDILIAKLRPGQAIELEAHARWGIGKDHAKYSPVATASYRLMPHVELLEDVYDDLADELVHVYEPGVFDIVPTDETDPKGVSRKARVCNPYACTMSRNYTRIPQLEKAIRVTRIPDHFIFSVESVGMYTPGVLVAEALRALQRKCQHVIDLADENGDKVVA
jgi:DNA-directed RNA polymerase I and III subunit RPAC1